MQPFSMRFMLCTLYMLMRCYWNFQVNFLHSKCLYYEKTIWNNNFFYNATQITLNLPLDI